MAAHSTAATPVDLSCLPEINPAHLPSGSLDRTAYDLMKRAMDLSICAILFIPMVSLLGVIALAVLILDGRPIFIAQPRTGRGARLFRMYKFRTMVRNAEELKEKYRHLNELTWPDFKITNDPRVTKLGGFLRKTSLDELPQLFNVLRGQMSLVGPRPTSFSSSTYQLWQTERLEVLPGITGLWQIRGRSDIDFDDRSRLDIQYVNTRSVLLDLTIIIHTIPAVLFRRGAY